MSSSAKKTPTGEPSSPAIGPESRSTRTFACSHIRNSTDDADHWNEAAQANCLAAEPLDGIPGHVLAVNMRGREGGANPELSADASLRAADGGSSRSLICSQAGSPAKTSPSPAEGQDSTGADPACSSSSPASQGGLFAPEGGFSLRTCPDFFPPTADATSRSYERRWPTSGSWTGPGECWTHDSSECPSGGGVSSSLRDVLHRGTVPERFFLSPRAAAGILRRAQKRGRTLPPALLAALTALASTHPDGAKRTT